MRVDESTRREVAAEWEREDRTQVRAFKRRGLPFRLYLQTRAKMFSARAMQRRPTPAEVALWEKLKQARQGDRWRRQRRALWWILDFFCPKRALAVEVDGPVHASRWEQDRRRDATLAGYGVLTLRFSNEEVLSDPDGVVGKIKAAARGRREVALPKRPLQ